MKLTVKDKLSLSKQLSDEGCKQDDINLLKHFAPKSRLLNRPSNKVEDLEVIYALLDLCTQEEIVSNRLGENTVIEEKIDIVPEGTTAIPSGINTVIERGKDLAGKAAAAIASGVNIVKKKAGKKNTPTSPGKNGKKKKRKKR